MPLLLKGCDKCGGDLYLDEGEFKEFYWHCFQCGHHQKEPGGKKEMAEGETLEIRPTNPTLPTKEKRKYTKGPKFYERVKRQTGTSTQPGYLEKYRQAVLDMSPKETRLPPK